MKKERIVAAVNQIRSHSRSPIPNATRIHATVQYIVQAYKYTQTRLITLSFMLRQNNTMMKVKRSD